MASLVPKVFEYVTLALEKPGESHLFVLSFEREHASSEEGKSYRTSHEWTNEFHVHPSPVIHLVTCLEACQVVRHKSG